ncbi:hypothetical protein OQA88_9667 [Cercophora sp. LCS_1]
MKSISLIAGVLLAATTAVAQTGTPTTAKGVQEPSTAPMLNVLTPQGCYSDSGTMNHTSTPQFNTKGLCSDTCLPLGFKVSATSGGNQCWCGNEYPIEDSLVDDKKCNVPCPGFDKQACGGVFFWSVYNTGLDVAVVHADKYKNPPKTTTSSTQGPVKTVTSGPAVVTSEPSDTPAEKGGTNAGAIAGGVVVGVVAIAAGVIGMFVYMRRKRNKEIEEEHRRNAAVSSFISGKAPSSSGGMSITDSRLDPVLAHRRMSDGSIADNQDYSRKILRVTNA